jgi:hypothetical protein
LKLGQQATGSLFCLLKILGEDDRLFAPLKKKLILSAWAWAKRPMHLGFFKTEGALGHPGQAYTLELSFFRSIGFFFFLSISFFSFEFFYWLFFSHFLQIFVMFFNKILFNFYLINKYTFKFFSSF